MDLKQEIAFIQKTFKKVKDLEQQKYRKGQLLHQDMTQNLEKDDNYENYRLEFITMSVSKIFNWMEDLSMEFNKKYPNDRFTMNDMKDILSSSLEVLHKTIGA